MLVIATLLHKKTAHMKLQMLAALFFSATQTISAQTNVGVGTNTPAEKLEVAGNIKADTVKTK